MAREARDKAFFLVSSRNTVFAQPQIHWQMTGATSAKCGE